MKHMPHPAYAVEYIAEERNGVLDSHYAIVCMHTGKHMATFDSEHEANKQMAHMERAIALGNLEDECPSVSCGGMASDLGLFCHCGMEMDKHDAGCGHSAIAIEEPGEPFVFTDYECVKCGGGFYLPSGVCDHCNQKHPIIDHYEAKRRVQSFNVGDTLRMPNYDTAGGFRVWSVEGVHLGAEGIESVYRLKALDVKRNALANDTYVPCIMLETHPEVEKV